MYKFVTDDIWIQLVPCHQFGFEKFGNSLAQRRIRGVVGCVAHDLMHTATQRAAAQPLHAIDRFYSGLWQAVFDDELKVLLKLRVKCCHNYSINRIAAVGLSATYSDVP